MTAAANKKTRIPESWSPLTAVPTVRSDPEARGFQ
jgi:hypothetical protein